MRSIISATEEVIYAAIPVILCIGMLCAFGYYFIRPDIVAYECPVMQPGKTLKSSTYDGKSVTCSYIATQDSMFKPVMHVKAKEIR